MPETSERIQKQMEEGRQEIAANRQGPMDNSKTKTAQDNSQSAISSNKIGRNDPCPCGTINPTTGQVYKWKKCGMINAPHHKR